jgi:hypothetical protein
VRTEKTETGAGSGGVRVRAQQRGWRGCRRGDGDGWGIGPSSAAAVELGDGTDVGADVGVYDDAQNSSGRASAA